ncbi:gamma-secretase subunit Aph-1 [Biomphalaria glabrata]|uniref:Gamma-secretase subunit Aph-1-like n=2 Tax=Biomphalaria TaxID=6525 RepID=A0A2C9K6P4_BIOGL|nr:gamma-secretase subunit Aph-1-like [Biomphalaria glabrata]XP_055899957.1 gamma-secretase subunit Aph-1-like [Biomphalaria glabrata]XP_055899958.1 gamma-secretase subunit Aph-1-like [Biomphalaria glabrata]XP_055899959.1 gamma-secretase subunit Aph-1-like [Biomphalaria glabrata]KAI8781164.1 gamma-secretase subunit Aph-1 [Biomphalaria glabrata]
MTLMEFFGCTFIAFGPPIALFIFTIAKDPMRVIVLIASSFFWLIALLISSILWFAVVPLRETLAFGLVFSVLFQELFRFLFYKIMRLANEGLIKVSQQSDNSNITPRDFANTHIMAYVSGLGFGLMSGAFSLINVLADLWGPGSIGIHGDSKYFFWSSSYLTLCFILLHTMWGVIFFAGMDRKCYFYVAYVVATHMLVSCLTLLNQLSSSTDSAIYLGPLIPAYIILVVSGIFAFYTAGGSLANIKNCVTCRKRRYQIE